MGICLIILFLVNFLQNKIMSAGIIFLLILALLLVIFTLQNPTTVDLHVFFWNIHEVSLVLALIICLILGVVLALLLSYPKIWKLKGQLKETQKRLTKLEEQNSEALEKPHAEGVEITDGQDDPSFLRINFYEQPGYFTEHSLFPSCSVPL